MIVDDDDDDDDDGEDDGDDDGGGDDDDDGGDDDDDVPNPSWCKSGFSMATFDWRWFALSNAHILVYCTCITSIHIRSENFRWCPNVGGWYFWLYKPILLGRTKHWGRLTR